MAKPVRKPARFDKLDHALRRRFHTELRYAHRHLLALLVVALILGPLATIASYRLGAHNQATHDAQFYAQLVKLNAYQPPAYNRVALEPIHPVQSPTGHVLWKFLNLDPENQGTVGFCNCASFVREYDYAFYKQTGLNYHFSCEFLYGLVVFLRLHGKAGEDNGSVFGDYPTLLSEYGAPLNSQYNWQGEPTSIGPPPQSVYALAARHKYQVVEHTITNTYGGGIGMIERMERAIHFGHPLDCTADVTGPGTGGFLDANQTGGIIDSNGNAAKPEPNLGGHAFTCVGYKRTMCRTTMYGATCGFFLIKSPWPFWGGSLAGTPASPAMALKNIGGGGNFAWVSYRYMKQYANGINWLSVHKKNPPRLPLPPPWHQPGPRVDRPKVAPVLPENKLCIGCDRYVYNVRARDTGLDMAPYINAVARSTGLTATGVAAVIYAECGFFTTSPTCDRTQAPPDDSFGCCQITIQTAAQFGLGNGVYDGLYGPNTTLVKNYENFAPRGIHLGGLVLGSYRQYELRAGCPTAAQLPNLYVAWNAGPANPCSWLSYPTGQAGANYYGTCTGCGFLAAYRYAQSFGSATDRYSRPHPSFPQARWGAKVASHYHGHLTLAAVYWWRGHTALGAAQHIRYVHGHPGYHKIRFAARAIYCFDNGRCKVGGR